MRYVAFADLREDMEKSSAKGAKFQEEYKKNPDKYPRFPLGLQLIADTQCLRGFAIWEAETEEQIANKIMFMCPEFKYEVNPIIDSGLMEKAFLKMKK
jgi:hypothetical protein